MDELKKIDIKDFQSLSSAPDNCNILLVQLEGNPGKISIGLFKTMVKRDIIPSIKDGLWWIGESATEIQAEGKTPVFRKGESGIEWKYDTEPEEQYRKLIDYSEIALTYDDLTPEQRADIISLENMTPEEIALLQSPANDMITVLMETNKKLNEAELVREESEGTRETAESRRNASEQSRQTSETDRVYEEQARESAEATRVTSENARKTAETGRSTAETTRDTAEKKRISDEGIRESNEQVRKSSETNRANAESERAKEEDKRKTAETTRSSNETVRVTQEDKRKADETTRQNNEAARVSDENTRSQSETVRTNDETARKSAEEARILEEGKRKTSETGRVNAESGRSSAETIRVQNENVRKSTEEARKADETNRAKAEAERVKAEEARKAEYGGVIDEMNQATEDATAQLGLVKKATDDANAAKDATVAQTDLAKKATDDANKAAGSVNESKEAALQAAGGANAAKTASEAQTSLAKKATDDANAAAGNANQKAALAGEKAALADAAAALANNAVAGVDAKVKAAIDALVAGAPGALDTLLELANALNNDPNFASTMAAELGKKLNITDIVNNLTTGGIGKALSAEQGKALKAVLDSHNHDAVYEKIITKLTAFNKNFGTTAGTVCQGDDSRLSNARPPLAHTHKVSEISDFPTSMPASDVPSWAKEASKPSYTASEVNAASWNHDHSGTYEPVFTKNTAFNKNFGSSKGTVCQGDDSRLSDSRYPLSHSHRKSDIDDFPSSMPASDVYSWAKQQYKPSYSASEVGASPSNHNHSGVYQPVGNYAASSHKHNASDVNEETNKRFMTDAERKKLGGIADSANNYSHPANHPASMIQEEANKKFMTDDEKSALSSLGTSYAKADFSNITSKSMGQNGYYKLPDGLLIQWGNSSSSGANKTVYFPTSFYDNNYKVLPVLLRQTSDTTNLTCDIYTKSSSYFVMFGLYHSTDSNNGKYWGGFDWIAIGRWK